MPINRKRSLVTCLFLALLATGIFAGVASAQEDNTWMGSFTLPFEARWGNTVLPPGGYTFSVQPGIRLWSSVMVYREGKFILSMTPSRPTSSCPTEQKSLILARTGHKQAIYVLHLGKEVFYFGTPRQEGELIAAGVAPSKCCHVICCDSTMTSGHVHAELIKRIPVLMGGK
jgi:hypothetical protein